MKTKTQYAEYLERKRIVLVGPSPFVLTKREGNLIDSYDIVVRIKKSYPVPKKLHKFIGKKTDILCTHLKLTQNNFDYNSLNQLQKDISWIVSPFPLIKPFDKFYRYFDNYYTRFLVLNKHYKKKPIHVVTNLDYYNNHVFSMKTTPTTATAFLLDILQYNFKELYITGITFRTDGYYPQYKSKEEDSESLHRTTIQRQVHDFDKELQYLKPILINDTRITYDNKLKLLLEN
jgi:hypothetical protein